MDPKQTGEFVVVTKSDIIIIWILKTVPNQIEVNGVEWFEL